VPFRREFETDFSYTRGYGYSASTYLTFRVPQADKFAWSGEMAMGLLYADKDAHDYFYTVKPEFSREDRPAYESKSGYSGKSIIFLVNKRFGQFIVFPFLKYDNLDGVAFRDSPLVRKNDYTVFGVGVYHLWF
jgi:MipA family protein